MHGCQRMPQGAAREEKRQEPADRRQHCH
jgi:hypothetical protein